MLRPTLLLLYIAEYLTLHPLGRTKKKSTNALYDKITYSFLSSMKFGLFSVDFSDPLRRRTARASALYYSNIIKHHSLDVADYSHHYQHLKGVDAPHNDAVKNIYQFTLLFIVSLVYTIL